MKLWVAMWHVKSNWIASPQKNQNLVAHTPLCLPPNLMAATCHHRTQDMQILMCYFPCTPITNMLWDLFMLVHMKYLLRLFLNNYKKCVRLQTIYLLLIIIENFTKIYIELL